MPTKQDVDKERKDLNDFYQARSSASRFMGSWGGSYKGQGPHGLNVWEGNPKCKLTNNKTGN